VSAPSRARAAECVPHSIALFDLGDVVATFDPAPRIAAYARRSGLSPAEVRERLSLDDFWTNTDRGAYSAEEMHEQICGRLGCRFARDELRRLQASAFRVRPEVLRVAETVSTRVGILTNNAPLLEEALPTYLPEIVRVFDPILFSFRFRHVKPEPELFAAAGAWLAVPPDRIFFVDDQIRHVSAARAAGWDAVQFESPSRLRRSLAERGFIGAAS
jgi:HAD superfamily hydrolase (TIGR01509 family)